MPIRNHLAGFSRIARSQATVVRNAARGWPLTYTGTTAMTLDADDLDLAAALLANRSDWTSDAPVNAFEREFAAWNGSRFAAAFASGRVALAAAIAALGLRAGDHVVMPGYSCVVVANALRNAGVQPILALRAKEGLRGTFVDQEQLFDYYNYGRYGPAAIQKAVRASRPLQCD